MHPITTVSSAQQESTMLDASPIEWTRQILPEGYAVLTLNTVYYPIYLLPSKHHFWYLDDPNDSSCVLACTTHEQAVNACWQEVFASEERKEREQRLTEYLQASDKRDQIDTCLSTLCDWTGEQATWCFDEAQVHARIGPFPLHPTLSFHATGSSSEEALIHLCEQVYDFMAPILVEQEDMSYLAWWTDRDDGRRST